MKAKKVSKYVSHQPDANGIVHYPAVDNETWQILIERQLEVIKDRACQRYIDGIAQLGFPMDRIPQLYEVNKVLEAATGWGVEQVPAIIPAEEFFTLLSNKRFPAATFIRTREDLNYIKEPDIFHELFGHAPLLTCQHYADFMEAYTKQALRVSGKERLHLFRLFWFTIEFGLFKQPDGMKIYGGGILSSKGETEYCVDPEGGAIWKPLDPLEALRTPYRIDVMQPLYFYIESFDELFNLIDLDLVALVREAQALGDYDMPSNEAMVC